ncbi:hypothetical protein GCM10011571_22310 [Marinithermofilum abyssi]|uniref:Anti-sigma-W factor RsiW n=1 Tax=Marinithermofilum abyssi TaxID=1571185 RepID=A0A8J2VC34_9BACL|nr:zf-HC2 domain-containing protein [Marinithermofilum abyssi]GGE19894.1 hypothetical protein GCM10011571_22310 [Marinithermofilum abyssi]
MSCRDMDRLIQLYVDQEITAEDRVRLRRHAADCEECRSNLQEMIALVQSLEEIRLHAEADRQFHMPTLFKWVAVYTTIFAMVYFSPQMEREQADLPGTSSVRSVATSSAGNTDTVRSQVAVLATQSEKLHIPDGDYIHVIPPRSGTEDVDTETAWVYPSAVPILIKDRPPWYREFKRLVFVRVPDNKTLISLAKTAGLDVEKNYSSLRNMAFPTSVILTTGEQPHVQTFTFPQKEENIARWFDKLATTQSLR